jgi:hypothetical protein
MSGQSAFNGGRTTTLSNPSRSATKLTIISMAAGECEQDRWHVGQIPQLEAHMAGMTGRPPTAL